MSESQTNQRHAEYKIPGGKLLVLDFQLHANKLSKVQLSGDFFMEPPEALDVINDTLEGIPADFDEQDLIKKLSNNLGDSVTLYGITLEGIIVVIKRALSWKLNVQTGQIMIGS